MSKATGKYDEAENMNQRALENCEKEMGKRHLFTLTMVDYLARVLRDRGKYDEAKKMNQRVLEGREKKLGKQYPDTLTSASAVNSRWRTAIESPL